MDSKIIFQNLEARDTHPRHLPLCEVWGHDGFLHICFSSVGCRFREAGYCTVCDYGSGRNITEKEAVKGTKQAILSSKFDIQEILLGTCGSILDQREMPHNVLRSILETVYSFHIPSVILETHYTTVNDQILDWIATLLPNREIVIEMGFESANTNVLEYSLGKYIDLQALADTIRCILRHGMYPVLNVFLGAPFLTSREQIMDTIKAVAWAFEHGASRVVIFPANIKPNTLLWKLWKNGDYHRISQWMLIQTLSQLNDFSLERVDISWFGDRQEAGKHTYALPPESCQNCKSELMNFYQNFQLNHSAKYRRDLLNQLYDRHVCNCRKNFLAEV